VYDFLLVINSLLTFRLSCSVSKLRPIVGQIFAVDMGLPHFNTLAGGDTLRISRYAYLSRN